MSGSLNLVVLVGRLGRDPEIRYAQSGDAIAHLSLATSERWTKTGEKHERTDWHRVEVFGKAAQFARDFVNKGCLVSVEGSIRYDTYKDRDGAEKHKTSIRAQRLELLNRPGGAPEARSSAPASTPVEPEPFVATDEDVPF